MHVIVGKKVYRRVLVLGTGFIGRRILDSIPDGVASNCDVLDGISLEKEFARYRPEVVVNACGNQGNSNVDWCEDHQNQTVQINVEGARIVSKLCKEHGCYLIHLSSGCFFQGFGPHCSGWRPSDLPQAHGAYLNSKLEAEKIVRSRHTAILRIRLPIDHIPHPRNLITKLIGFEQIVVDDNSITIVDELVEFIRHLSHTQVGGTYHCVEPLPAKLNLIREQSAKLGLSDSNFKVTRTHQLHENGLVRLERTACVLSSSYETVKTFKREKKRSKIHDLLCRYKSYIDRRRGI